MISNLEAIRLRPAFSSYLIVNCKFFPFRKFEFDSRIFVIYSSLSLEKAKSSVGDHFSTDLNRSEATNGFN